MKKIDLEAFCNEIINFNANKKDYSDTMDNAILKSLKIKRKKIQKNLNTNLKINQFILKKLINHLTL